MHIEETRMTEPKEIKGTAMTNKPRTFKHISRCVDNHGVHHLDALDDYGRHWYATMQQKEEPWLTYVQPWELWTH